MVPREEGEGESKEMEVEGGRGTSPGTAQSCGVRRACGAAGLSGVSVRLTSSASSFLGQSRKSPLYRMKSGNRIATVMIYVSRPLGLG